MVDGVALAALILSVIAIIIGIVALIALVGFLRSTHKVQFVPLDPNLNEQSVDIDEQFKQFEKNQM
jgi:hypothetical protein